MKTQSKKYYYNMQLETAERIKGLPVKPSLLMHTCCAVCACYPIVWLTQYFDLTLYYYNDNIYPEDEYEKRYAELERYVRIFNQENNRNVKLIKCEYHNTEYTEKLVPYRDAPEGGERCHLCYKLRLEKG
ncbi:MAG: epoxyqueuosine reductase QueH, partial [Erysipelotrichaceae bacterium]|nr:epoxyqueuosine reductase QueH [Erysipelotrichaceae bacterium]